MAAARRFEIEATTLSYPTQSRDGASSAARSRETGYILGEAEQGLCDLAFSMTAPEKL